MMYTTNSCSHAARAVVDSSRLGYVVNRESKRLKLPEAAAIDLVFSWSGGKANIP